jgi:hypothetical protein
VKDGIVNIVGWKEPEMHRRLVNRITAGQNHPVAMHPPFFTRDTVTTLKKWGFFERRPVTKPVTSGDKAVTFAGGKLH